MLSKDNFTSYKHQSFFLKLKELAESLLEKEVIFKEDLVRIFGDRPGEEQTNNESEKKVDPAEKE